MNKILGGMKQAKKDQLEGYQQFVDEWDSIKADCVLTTFDDETLQRFDAYFRDYQRALDAHN